MSRQLLLKLSIPVIVLSALTSCSNRPYFVIENNTDKAVQIELLRDSVNLPAMVVKELIDHMPYSGRYGYKWDDPAIDSLRRSMLRSHDHEYFIEYAYDSLTLKSLLHNTWNSPQMINEFTIEQADLQPDAANLLDGDQNAFAYYRRDSALMKKVINEHTVTFFIPPHCLLKNRCHASGDASCGADEAFPDARELRIISESRREPVVLTKANLQGLMGRQKFNSQSNSLMYKIE